MAATPDGAKAERRAARKLWPFCRPSDAQVEAATYAITWMREHGEAIDWWQRTQPRR